MSVNPASAQDGSDGSYTQRISPFILDTVEIVRHDVFDSSAGIPIVTPVLDYIHIMSKESVVRNEIFVEAGDTVTQQTLDEIERNMRALTIFSSIVFQVIPEPGEEKGEYPHAKLRVITHDSWSTRLSATYDHADDHTSYGASVRETNLIGLGHQLGLGIDYTTINDRRWRFTSTYLDPNLYGTHLQVGGAAGFSKLEQSGAIFFGRPFYTDRLPNAFNAMAEYFDGTDFFYLPERPYYDPLGLNTSRTNVSAWYATSKVSRDVFRTSFSLAYNRTIRDSLQDLHSAFENTIGAYFGISSLSRTYAKVVDADFNGESEVPIGGMGSVTLGKIAPHSGGLDNAVYIGGEARKAVVADGLYGYAAVEAGTGLSGRIATFTLERATANGAVRIAPGWLVAHVQQTTVWNWPRYLFEPLDNNNGLRGYTRNSLYGDNKLAINVEYRLPPMVSLLMFKFGAAGFYDVGTVWNQGDQLGDLRFHSAAGLGLRVSSRNGQFDKGLLRVDFAYNFDERKFAQLIISSEEAFDLFGTLDYRPPAPYVP